MLRGSLFPTRGTWSCIDAGAYAAGLARTTASGIDGQQVASCVYHVPPARRPMRTPRLAPVAVEAPTHVVEIESQTPAGSADPDRVELLGVRVDPAAVDAERPSQRDRVDKTSGRRLQLVVNQGKDATSDGLDVVGVERHVVTARSAARGLVRCAARGCAPSPRSARVRLRTAASGGGLLARSGALRRSARSCVARRFGSSRVVAGSSL